MRPGRPCRGPLSEGPPTPSGPGSPRPRAAPGTPARGPSRWPRCSGRAPKRSPQSPGTSSLGQALVRPHRPGSETPETRGSGGGKEKSGGTPPGVEGREIGSERVERLEIIRIYNNTNRKEARRPRASASNFGGSPEKHKNNQKSERRVLRSQPSLRTPPPGLSAPNSPRYPGGPRVPELRMPRFGGSA